MAEPLPARLSSLTVRNGPRAGTQIVLEDLVDEVFIGSDPDSRLFLDLPGVSPIHARIWMDFTGATVRDTHSPRGLFLNDQRVVGEAGLKDGDVLWLGPPGEAQSVMIECGFSPPPDAVVAPAPPAAAEVATGPSAADIDVSAFPPEAFEAAVEAIAPDAETKAAPATRSRQEAGLPESVAPRVAAAPKSPAEADWVEEPLLEIGTEAPPGASDEPLPAEPLADPHEIGDFLVGGFTAEPEARIVDRSAMEELLSLDEPPLRGRDPVTPPGEEVLAAAPLAAEGLVEQPLAGTPPEPEIAQVAEPFLEADLGAGLFITPEAPAEPSAPESGTPTDDAPVSLASFADVEPFASADAPAAPAPSAPTPSGGLDEWAGSGHDVFFFEQEASSAPPELDTFFVDEPAPAARPLPEARLRQPIMEEDALETAGAEGPAAPAAEPVADASMAPADVGEELPAREAPASRAPRADATSRPLRVRPTATPRPPASAEAEAATTRARGKGRGLAALARYAAMGVAGIAVVAAGVFFAVRFMAAPALESISPARAAVGEALVLTGRNFAGTPEGNVVRVGAKSARVRAASQTRLEVEVPDVAPTGGADARANVTVEVRGSVSAPVPVAVYRAPRVQRLSPEVALPGEEVTLIGTGWGPGAVVRFGSAQADVLEAGPATLRVRVPALDGSSGTPVPVVVRVGTTDSSPASFFVGRLPLVVAVLPRAVAAGDLVSVSGRGFHAQAAANAVQIGPARALVVSATPSELKVIVPRPVPPGEQPLQVRVPTSPYVGESSITVGAPMSTVEFHFVAEPFVDVPGHDHALLATGLGPALVLSGAHGKSAAERALEAQRHLNEAAATLRARGDQDIEVREMEKAPALALIRESGTLVDVAPEDAAAYQEDWTKTGGRGGPVTPARLAVWWEAVLRDLVLMLVRGEGPRHAVALAAEGRVLGDLFRQAVRSGATGFPREPALFERPAFRDGMRTLALRVPAAVVVPTATAPPPPALTAAAAAAAAKPIAFKLEGTWTGVEIDRGSRRYVTMEVRGRGGSYSYEGGLTFTVPIIGLEQPQKGAVRFSTQMRGSPRYYEGHWDGARIVGHISSAAAGKGDIGTFELSPVR